MQIEINAIIEACKKGNQNAQMQLYDKYCDAMYTIACRYLNNEEAKDAMQEGFLKAFKNIKNYKADFTFGTWLKRIIINQCIDTFLPLLVFFTNSSLVFKNNCFFSFLLRVKYLLVKNTNKG